MELYIDGRKADTDSGTGVAVSVSVASITKPEYGRTGYARSVSIPMTATNRAIMGDCEQIYARDGFNGTVHEARIEYSGCVIMEGAVRLVSCDMESEYSGRYLLNVIGYGKKWAVHASSQRFSSLFPEFRFTVTSSAVTDSWTGDTPVRWLPVVRERYLPLSDSVGLEPAERVLSAEDYHPFIHLRTVVERIFSDAGYRLVSDFLTGDFFDSLYMSGNYPRRDVETLRKRMDFCARRTEPGLAAADASGRVYADPLTSLHSIGNIVDTVDPSQWEAVGGRGETYDNGGCFRLDGERIVFVPTDSVSVGFEYEFTYVTDYRIVSRNRLAGFDRLYLGGGVSHDFRITNRFADRREEFRAGKRFSLVVCDYTPGYEYRLDATLDDGTQVRTVTLATVSEMHTVFDTAVQGAYSGLRLLYRTSASGGFVAFAGEWALYDGYVGVTGKTRVTVRVRSAAETVMPSEPKYFDTVYFAGADEGMELELEEACVRPVFSCHPAMGQTVSFDEVGAHDVSCMAVINALRAMFGLCFYTDEVSHTVFAEPRDMFYLDDVVVDWSDRLDVSRGYSLDELLPEVAGTLSWEYASGDGAVAEYNRVNGDDFGSFRLETGNPWRSDECKRYVNPLFTASVNVSGTLPGAPDASIVRAGDYSSLYDAYSDDLDFPAKVVRYAGLETLPEGQTWGWPGFGGSYPFAAFHNPAGGGSGRGEGFTLCYEDRDGAEGLHRWWDSLAGIYSRGKRLRAWVKLDPEDVEKLVRPDSLRADFRARFRLHIDGEWSEWRLEEVCDYDPEADAAQCVFIGPL